LCSVITGLESGSTDSFSSKYVDRHSGHLAITDVTTQLVLAIGHGTFIFVKDPAYGWYLSATATLLFISYFVHNIVSWLKIRPFLPCWGSKFFIISLLCVQPFWVAEAWSNFSYFNSLGSEANVRMRPWEALVRDPWWIFTTWRLLDVIKKTYGFKLWTLIRINRRFGVMLLCMFLSIAFLLTDVAVSAAKVTANSGINPYWRFALVFKCASDTIFLDDFKSVLDDIATRKFNSGERTTHQSSAAHSGPVGGKRSHSGNDFIECTSFDESFRMPIRNSLSSPEPTASRSGLKIPFSKKRKASDPKVETDETLKDTMPRIENWDNDATVLARPGHAMYGSNNLRATESDGSLFNGRLV
jgi:hypothetical protein